MTWSLRLDRRDSPQLVVIVASGRIGALTAAELDRTLAQVGPSRRVMLACRGVDYISSAGLNVLLRNSARLNESGGSLALTGLQEAVRVSLDVSGGAALLELADEAPGGSAVSLTLGEGPRPT